MLADAHNWLTWVNARSITVASRDLTAHFAVIMN
jgi:hypothetical protein